MSGAELTGSEIRLAARPQGVPVPSDFALATVSLPEPRDGELLVRNEFVSVDPYMRSRMNPSMVHMSPFEVGAALDGAAVGRVLRSRSSRFQEGDQVVHGLGWRDLAVVPADDARPAPTGPYPASAHLGVLGMPGMTAWYGLHEVARLQPGETVYVSAAAGAVGSTVGQLVRHRGGTVVGSAGSPEKVRHLREELGFDDAFDHRTDDPVAALRRAAPDGVDVYFDNVGGAALEAALECLRPFGRIVACGMVAHAHRPVPGPSNLPLLVGKRLSLTGFVISDHYALRPRFTEEMRELLGSGAVRVSETVLHGLGRAPEAFIGMLRGDTVGKTVVAV